jgi:hypothetical protein
VRLPVLVLCCLLSACGAASPAALERLEAVEGYSLSFPGPVRTRSGREGPFVFRIDSTRTPDGARFEAAWFGFPEPLDAPERATLLRRVEKGLAAGPGTTLVSRTVLSPAPAAAQSPSSSARQSPSRAEGVDLVFDREDGQRGFHRVLYPSPHAMLQVSVVGPRDGEWERDVPRFWGSVTLSGETEPFRGDSPWQARVSRFGGSLHERSERSASRPARALNTATDPAAP